MILYAIATAMVLVGSMGVASLVERRRFHIWVLVGATAGQLSVVISGRALSWLGIIDRRWGWLAGDLLFLLSVLLIWLGLGRPSRRIPSPLPALREFFAPSFFAPAASVLCVGAVSFMAVHLVATILIPQNMDDVLTAYMARIGFWIQQGDLAPYPASPYNSLQVSYPVNAQLSPLRSVVLAGRDNFVGLDQWLAGGVASIGIYALACQLGSRRGAAAWCGVAWLFAPAAGAQIGLALTDLVAVSGALSSAVFAWVGWTERRPALMAAATVALSLVVGTKQTMFFALPALALLLLVGLIIERERWKTWAAWMGASIPVLMVLGFHRYVSNWQYYGHPLGDPESFRFFATDSTFGSRFSALGENLQHAALVSFFGDVPPSIFAKLGGFGSWLQAKDSFIGTDIYVKVGLPWAGFFVSCVVLVGSVLAVGSAVRHRSRKMFVPLVPAVLYTLLLMVTRPNWSEAFSRYLLLTLAFLLVLAALGISKIHVESRSARALLGWLMFIAALGMVAQATMSSMNNGVRPLSDARVWSGTDTDLLVFSNGFLGRYEFAAAIREIDRCAPDGGPLGLVLRGKFPHSLLFGAEPHRRHLVQYKSMPRDLTAESTAAGPVGMFLVDTALVHNKVLTDPDLEVSFFGPVAVLVVKAVVAPGCVSVRPEDETDSS